MVGMVMVAEMFQPRGRISPPSFGFFLDSLQFYSVNIFHLVAICRKQVKVKIDIFFKKSAFPVPSTKKCQVNIFCSTHFPDLFSNVEMQFSWNMTSLVASCNHRMMYMRIMARVAMMRLSPNMIRRLCHAFSKDVYCSNVNDMLG